jgi:hypothetical protein
VPAVPLRDTVNCQYARDVPTRLPLVRLAELAPRMRAGELQRRIRAAEAQFLDPRCGTDHVHIRPLYELAGLFSVCIVDLLVCMIVDRGLPEELALECCQA